MRSATLRRGATLVAASALTISTFGAVSAPAQAHPAGDRAVAAAGTWLAGELQDGLLRGSFGPEIGPSIDAGMAFAAVGRASDAAAVADGIAPGLVTTANGEYGYARATEYDWETGDPVQVGRYANATAKAAAFAARIGRDPSTAYADIDLIAQLEDLTADTGLIADDSSYGNYANAIGQGLAVEALTVTGSTEATVATTALLQQQCASGYFRFALSSVGCAEGVDAPHQDATALAVLALVSSGIDTQAVTQAITRAATWLKSQQAADGSFSAGGTEGVNTNSTGLAAWALAEAGDAAEAAKSAGWLRGVQVADLAPCALTLGAENGALAPTTGALAGAREAGAVKPAQRLSYAFATAQALPALAKVPAATAPLAISAPATAVEKSTVDVTVAGLGAGEPGCVSFGTVTKPVTGTGGVANVAFQLPAGVATHTFTLTTLAGSQSATTSSTALPAPVTPVPPTPEVGDLVTKKVVTARNNWFKLAVDCDDTEWCAGKIVVRTLRKVRTGSTTPASKVLIAKRTYSVAPNTDEVLRLRVRKPARRLLDDGRTRVKAGQTAAGADRATTKFWLCAK